MPSVAGFRPVISNNSCEETIFLHFEEYETIRLCDYEMKTQQEASISMGVSRPTLSRIYTSARQKIAKAFVCGAAIMIEGGVSYTNSEWFRCGSCGFLFNNINPALKIRKTVCPVCFSEDIHTSNININKNKIMMKIAIPTRDNVIDNHFCALDDKRLALRPLFPFEQCSRYIPFYLHISVFLSINHILPI